jgi:hypothetical protein
VSAPTPSSITPSPAASITVSPRLREQKEGATEAQFPAFTGRCPVGEVPDPRRTQDLDQAVESEARKYDGAGAPGRGREYANTNNVPGECGTLERQPAPAQIIPQR